MANPLFKERRGEVRHPLMGDLSGSINFKGQALKCLGVDVSRDSLRILCFQELKPYSELLLRMCDQEITMLVIWCEMESPVKRQYAAGLKALGQNHDLVQLFQHSGWLEHLAAADEWVNQLDMVKIRRPLKVR